LKLQYLQMKKQFFLFFIFLQLCCFAIAQNKQFDSLWAIYNNKSQADTNRLKAIDYIAWSYVSNNPDTTIILAQEEVQLAQKSKQKIYEGNAFNAIGTSFMNKGNYPKTLEYYLKALKVREEIGDKKGVGSCYNNIGVVYREQSNYPKALEYNLKALQIRTEIGDKQGMGVCYSNIGSIYLSQSNYSNALEYNLKALKINEEINDKHGIGDCYTYIGVVYYYQSNYPKALEYYLKSLQLFKKISYKQGMGMGYSNIGELYNKLANYKSAIQYSDSSLQITKKIGDINTERIAYDNLAVAYSKTGRYKEAYENHVKFKTLTDSIFNADNSKQLGDMKNKYEMDKKEQENLLLQQTTQNQQLQINQRNYLVALLFALLLGIAGISLLVFRQNKLKSQQKSMQLEQKLLRSQMNPHFIFNSLIAIESYIYDKEPEKSGAYLSQFAQLMRQTLENSRAEYISLEKEISTLENYLALQQMRYDNIFTYTIHIAEDLDASYIRIPPMLTQPFIENAIEHGFTKNEKKGKIEINFKLQDHCLMGEVIDNGIGIYHSQKQTNVNQNHRSMALSITTERLELLNKGSRNKIQLHLEELKTTDGNVSGTRVYFSIPLKGM
jgi:tetratricopeptide (TPR) repeat protein